MDDAQLGVRTEQAGDAPGDGAVDTARSLRAAGHEDGAQTVAEWPRLDRSNFRTDRVAGVHDARVGQVACGLGERRGDHPGPAGKQLRRAPRERVLLEQHDGDALCEGSGDDRHRHVAAEADDHVGAEAARTNRRAAIVARVSCDVARAIPAGLPTSTPLTSRVSRRRPAATTRSLGHPVAAADHGHLVVRPGVSKRQRDGQRRGQVAPSSPPSYQRTHDSSSLAVDPGRRC